MGRKTYIETNTIVKWCCGTKWFDHKWLASVCVTQAHLIGPKIVTAVYLVRWVSVAVGTLTYGDDDVLWTEHVYWNHVVWLTVGCVVHLRDEPMCTWHDIQCVMLFNWSGNLGRLFLWWVTADRWLRATSTPSSKKLYIQEGEKDKLFADHVTQVCEAHNRVIVSFLQQVQGGTRPTTEGSRENIGHNVHVSGDRGRSTRL